MRILCLALYHILIGLFGSLESNAMSYILIISPLLDVGLVKIFPQFVVCHFVLLTVSFALQELCKNVVSLHNGILLSN